MPFEMSPRGRKFLRYPTYAQQFGNSIPDIERAAAELATKTSRAAFTKNLSGRPLAPERDERPTTGGQFANLLSWERDGEGDIIFNLAGLESAAKYWLIQEIGTNESANVPGMGSMTVRSQRGRKLPRTLYWSDGPGGDPTRPLRGGVMQQLYLVRDFQSSDGKEMKRASGRTGVIRREIEAKHFIRDGGFAGWTQMKDMMLAQYNRNLF